MCSFFLIVNIVFLINFLFVNNKKENLIASVQEKRENRKNRQNSKDLVDLEWKIKILFS